MVKQTKTEALLKHLQKGHDLTEGQIRSRFGIASVRDAATRLRQSGFPVYCNRKTLSNGRVASVYRLGTPRRAVIAAGYRALAQA